MKTKPKKTVTAWAWTRNNKHNGRYIGIGADVFIKKSDAESFHRADATRGKVGPIVKIALPLPKEKKR